MWGCFRCVFPADPNKTHDEGRVFPNMNGPFGVLPISFRPFLDLENQTYEMPITIKGWLSAIFGRDQARLSQWDEIEDQMKHNVGVANTLQVTVCIKIDGFCIKNDGFCIKIDEFCIKSALKLWILH